MKESLEKTKETVLSIAKSVGTYEDKLKQYDDLLGSLRPLDNAEEILLVCNAGILCADKLNKTEMIAQFCFLLAQAELSKASHLIHEMKNLTLALGYFSFALKSEKDRYNELEKNVQEIWTNTQRYINTGFEYINKKPYIGPAGYCQKMAGEIYANFYLQLRLYSLNSGRPWRSKIANFKLIRFFNLEDLLLIDKKSRKRTQDIKRDCLNCFKEAMKYYKEDKAWSFLADCYISLGLEHHSFNNPIRSKIYLYKAGMLIKKYKIPGLDKRLESVRSMPIIGSDRD